MERNKIKGFSFNLLNYTFEIVTINFIPKVFSISKPIYKTLLRFQ